MEIKNIILSRPEESVGKCDWSRILAPPMGSQASVYNKKNYGVTITVWDALSPIDTFSAKMVISIDTEYQSNPAHGGNDILSYQILAYEEGGKMAQLIFHIPDDRIGHRLSLSELVDETRKALEVKVPILRSDGKKRIEHAAIRIIAHFSPAEWAALRDRTQFAAALQIIRKSPVSLSPSPINLKLSNRTVATSLEVVDTSLIAPAKFRSLGAVGDVVDVAKVKLPEGAIEQMQQLRRDNPELFDLYAITDCRVALAFYLEMQRIVRDVLHLDKLGPTLGSIAVSKCVSVIGEKKYLNIFGLKKVKANRKQKVVLNEAREHVESFAAAAFKGGLNMAYPRQIDGCLVLDIDFTSCYPSAGATLPAIDWQAMIDQDPRPACKPDASDKHTPISIAHVEFEFPESCTRPTIPVDSGARGLIYPLKGTGYATHFELDAALAKGAKIKILRQEIFPPRISKDGADLALAEFFKLMVVERSKHPKGSLENLLFKEIANSVYGKLAQGVKPRNVRSFGDTHALPNSKITCPAYATAITGLVRAALIGLMDAVEQVGGVVLAATTDGAMVAFPKIKFKPEFLNSKGKPEVDISAVPGLYEALMDNPAIRALSRGRQNMGCDPLPVEVKSAGDNAHVLKTRGYYLRFQEEVQHIAKCNLQLNGMDVNKQALALKMFSDMDTIPSWNMSYLASAQKIYDGKASDVVRINESRRVNVDYDFKMIPDGLGGFRPPRTLEEFNAFRDTVDNIRRAPKPDKNGKVKKSKRATINRVMMARSGIRVYGDEEASLRRMFLYAIVQDIAGLHPRDADGSKILSVELARRARVSTNDIKNAKRRTFKPPPRTEIALHVLQDILNDTHLSLMNITQEMEVLFAKI